MSDPTRYEWCPHGMRPSTVEFGTIRYINQHDHDRLVAVLRRERDTARADADMRANALGRIAIVVFGEANNVDDEACVAKVEQWAAIVRAASALSDEGQEYSFDDIGLGRGAPNSYWEDLDEALDPDDAAIDGKHIDEHKADEHDD